MFCATCFQTAEEGSKYCAGCRQAREGKEGDGAEPMAWSALPEAPAVEWGATSKVAWQPGEDAAALVASAWDEGNVWTPPLTSEVTPRYAARPDGVGAVVPPEEPTPPRAVIGPPLRSEEDRPSLLDIEHQTVLGTPLDQVGQEPAMLQTLTVVSQQAPPVVFSGHHVEVGPAPQPDLPLVGASPLPLRRSNKGITAMLLAGFLLLSVTAVGQVFRAERKPTVAHVAEPAKPKDANSEAAQRFLTSAKTSMAAKDFELAALQLQEAVAELNTAGAPEGEIAAAKLLLAQARFREGKLEKAHSLCAELAQSGLKGEAKKLSGQVEKELRKQAQALLASAHQDVRDGRLTPALQKTRNAKKMLQKYGGSPDQIKRAEVLLTRAVKAEGALGLQRSQRPQRRAAEKPVYEGQDRPRRGTAYPRYQRPIPPDELPVAARPPGPRRRPVPPEGVVPTERLPMANILGRRKPPSQPEGLPQMPQMPEQPGEQQPSSGPAQSSAPAGNAPTAPRPATSNRDRAGSEDVLPTYNSQGGGSVY